MYSRHIVSYKKGKDKSYSNITEKENEGKLDF